MQMSRQTDEGRHMVYCTQVGTAEVSSVLVGLQQAEVTGLLVKCHHGLDPDREAYWPTTLYGAGY